MSSAESLSSMLSVKFWDGRCARAQHFTQLQIRKTEARVSDCEVYQVSNEGAVYRINPFYTEQTLPHYIFEESNFNFR